MFSLLELPNVKPDKPTLFLRRLASDLGCACRLLSTHPGIPDAQRRWAEVGITRVPSEQCFTPTRVAVAGAAGAGKSTLVSVLLRAGAGFQARQLDDGCGGARAAVAAHKHELLSGRTSALRHHLLAYDAEGAPCEADRGTAHALRSLCELPSSDKYSKTALRGLTATRPHALMLCCAAGPLPPAARQHLAAALALRVPVFCALTHADAAGGGAASAPHLRELLCAAASAFAACRGASAASPEDVVAPMIQDEQGAGACARSWQAQQRSQAAHQLQFPLLPLSCVTGQGLATLHAFLCALCAPTAEEAQRSAQSPPSQRFTFPVEALLSNAEAGTLAAGVCVAGGLSPGHCLWLGPVEGLPEPGASFIRLTARSIHTAGSASQRLLCGQAASLALCPASATDGEALARATATQRKGLLLLGGEQAPPPPQRLLAAVLVPLMRDWRAASLMLHAGSVRASARVLSECAALAQLEEELGDVTARAAAAAAVLGHAPQAPLRVVFEMRTPQWVRCGEQLLVAEAGGGLLATGTVVDL